MSQLQIEHLQIKCEPTQATINKHNKRNDTIQTADIEVEIIPHSGGKNIAQINGSYEGHKCTLDRSDLHGLALQLKGTGGTLTERVSLHLNGKQDKKGEFNMFLTCMCTTLVQFRLWGEVFPDVETPIEKVSADVLRDEVFSKLKAPEYSKSKNKALSEWVSGINSFWDRWHKWFNKDVTKGVLEQQLKELGQEVQMLQQLVKKQGEQIAQLQMLINYGGAGRQNSTQLEERINQLEQMLNCSRRTPNFKF